MPNTSFNIFYHLGLARYLVRDFAGAEAAAGKRENGPSIIVRDDERHPDGSQAVEQARPGGAGHGQWAARRLFEPVSYRENGVGGSGTIFEISSGPEMFRTASPGDFWKTQTIKYARGEKAGNHFRFLLYCAGI